MDRRTTLLATVIAALLASSPAAAGTIVNLLVESGREGGFGFSLLHSAESSCTFIDSVQFCMSGATQDSLSGSLQGELDGVRISGITGSLALASGGVLEVTDGVFDFSGAYRSFESYLETSYGTFHFLNYRFAGPANSFNLASVRAWGNNWDNLGTGDPGDGTKRWGMDFGARVTEATEAAVPEPGAAVVFGLGLLIARAGILRRR